MSLFIACIHKFHQPLGAQSVPSALSSQPSSDMTKKPWPPSGHKDKGQLLLSKDTPSSSSSQKRKINYDGNMEMKDGGATSSQKINKDNSGDTFDSDESNLILNDINVPIKAQTLTGPSPKLNVDKKEGKKDSLLKVNEETEALLSKSKVDSNAKETVEASSSDSSSEGDDDSDDDDDDDDDSDDSNDTSSDTSSDGEESPTEKKTSDSVDSSRNKTPQVPERREKSSREKKATEKGERRQEELEAERRALAASRAKAKLRAQQNKSNQNNQMKNTSSKSKQSIHKHDPIGEDDITVSTYDLNPSSSDDSEDGARNNASSNHNNTTSSNAVASDKKRRKSFDDGEDRGGSGGGVKKKGKQEPSVIRAHSDPAPQSDSNKVSNVPNSSSKRTTPNTVVDKTARPATGPGSRGGKIRPSQSASKGNDGQTASISQSSVASKGGASSLVPTTANQGKGIGNSNNNNTNSKFMEKKKAEKPPLPESFSHDTHPSRSMVRPLLGNVLSDNVDKAKAFNAIRCMVELQRSGVVPNVRLGLNQLDTKTPVPVAVNKIPLPLSSEIMYCLDLLEIKSDICWDQLAEIQRVYARVRSGEYILVDEEGKPTPNPCTNMNRHPNTVPLRQVNPSISELLNPDHPLNKKLPINLINTIAKVNIERIEEAHIYEKVLPEGPTHLNGFSMIRQDVPLYTSPNKAPYFEATEAAMLKIKRQMTAEIRKRKLAKQTAWTILANRYIDVSAKWNVYVDEKERIIRESSGRGLGKRGSVLDNPSYSTRDFYSQDNVARTDYDQDILLSQLEQEEVSFFVFCILICLLIFFPMHGSLNHLRYI